MATTETIFAVSSGAPPAAIAVIRISGSSAADALMALAGRLPSPRRASLATLRKGDGDILDHALILWFPGPHSATGEDLAEIHAHGGRAVVDGITAALAALPGFRAAEPGEFTRRSVMNGRMDLAEAEGLADLIEAQTDEQRRRALAMASGDVSAQVRQWQDRLVMLAARVEALLDFVDEDDVDDAAATTQLLRDDLAATRLDLMNSVARPLAERLHDGIFTVIAGPPNAGKSTLFNALIQRDAAIVTPIAGTTRDIIEASVQIDGIAYRFADTAGLRDSEDMVEQIGVARSASAMQAADMILWLGSVDDAPDHPMVLRVAAKSDLAVDQSQADISISALTGAGMDALGRLMAQRARHLLPHEDEVAFNRRQHRALADAAAALSEATGQQDLLLVAESLRHGLHALDRITGQADTEAVLDALFGRFCIGK